MGRIRTSVAVTLALAAAAGAGLVTRFSPGPAAARAAGPRPPEAIVADMKIAKTQLAATLGDPRDLADPAKRPPALSRAGPPLRRLVADDRELAATSGHPGGVPSRFQVQLEAMLSAMDDPAATADLAALAADPQVPLRGRGGQLLARWLQVPGDGVGQGRVADDLATLDAAHPESDDLAVFTALMTGSSATPAVRARLRAMLEPMTAPRAAALRTRMPATAAATRP